MEHRRIGDYVLGEVFASGGMATLHLGRFESDRFARTVAIKRLRSDLAAEDDDLTTLLLREARFGAQARHPNVSSVVDLVVHEGEIFLVSEYIDGVSLADLLRDARDARAPLPLPIVGAIASDLLRGLHSIHEHRRLVHRDVSPENVVVGMDGVARLIDFGIASDAECTRLTKTGQFRGKVAYLPPDSWERDRVLDSRVDVYSAAVVIWEMLAGRRLFDAAAPTALFEQVAIAMIDPVRRFRSEVPRAVDELLTRALSSDPERRPASAHDVACELQHHLVPAGAAAVSQWVEKTAARRVTERRALVERFERALARPTDEGAPAESSSRPSRRRWVLPSVLGVAFVGILALARSEPRLAPLTNDARSNVTPGAMAERRDELASQSDSIVAIPPSRPALRSAASPSRIVSAPKRAAACEMPYRRDARGNKIYRLECL